LCFLNILAIVFKCQFSRKHYVLKVTAFWNIAPCSLAEDDLRFRRVTRLQSAVSHKAIIFMLAAVRTWNPTYFILSRRKWHFA
jgi:hypothetical protein